MRPFRPAALGSAPFLFLSQVAACSGGPPGKSDPVIEKARSVTASFLEHLPNYVCQEAITQYTAGSRTGKWRRGDVITTELMYEDSYEEYRNVTINAELIGTGIEGLPGNWFVGEFATDFRDFRYAWRTATTPGDFQWLTKTVGQ